MGQLNTEEAHSNLTVWMMHETKLQPHTLFIIRQIVIFANVESCLLQCTAFVNPPDPAAASAAASFISLPHVAQTAPSGKRTFVRISVGRLLLRSLSLIKRTRG